MEMINPDGYAIATYRKPNRREAFTLRDDLMETGRYMAGHVKAVF